MWVLDFTLHASFLRGQLDRNSGHSRNLNRAENISPAEAACLLTQVLHFIGGKILARHESPAHSFLDPPPDEGVDGVLRTVMLNKSRKYKVRG